MGYICTRCGGTNVACEAIVNPNTGKIIDYFDGSFMHAICSNCENEVIISNIEEVKHEIDLRFHEFVEKTGKEPEYVECQIVWKKTGDEQCPECYGYDTLVWVDEDRQEMDTKHLDCLAPMRKLELQEYLSQDVLAIEHSEYYKQLIGEDEWCEEEI